MKKYLQSPICQFFSASLFFLFLALYPGTPISGFNYVMVNSETNMIVSSDHSDSFYDLLVDNASTSYLDSEIFEMTEERLHGELSDLRPNPAREFTRVTVALPGRTTNARLMVRNLVGNLVLSHQLNNDEITVTLDTSELSNGIYIISLVANNQTLDSKRLVVAR